ncbi:alpha-L-rhamnosidase-related protein [Chitinophaga cymbidii]|uniref:alpha-L-rhamnosidase n=1 Tax=Chitinophaga cymbidii TaxID=1096750 RepID=A0A512RJH0_9BACT|nr:alpha-L-rhamnosidase C-terminal domain-containing protein [Chitinophaga cymbidii]GEP95851.1 hypothetical protein CCY01nite_21110 [Chitinophaga cymbidii]
MHKKLVHFIAVIIFALPASAQVPAPDGLLCDLLAYTDMQVLHGYPVQPMQAAPSVRIANRQPAFSWAIPGYAAGMQQSAYRILLADHPDTLFRDRGNLWDSDKVPAATSAGIVYNGQALQPNKRYYWKVKIWDDKGRESSYSSPAVFFTDSVLTDYATAKYPLQKTDQLPVRLSSSAGTYRADFGKAAFGQIKLRLQTAGHHDTVLVHLGEAVLEDGSINRKPGGTIRYQVYKLPLRPGLHTYQVQIRPDRRNTGPQAIKMPAYIGEVLPFRYCEIEGYKGTLQQTDVTRAAVNYPFNDSAAMFHSADTVLNAVWELCKYSMKATSFAGIYVDGDRERIPYEADAYINQLGHYAADREFSLARASHEYLLHHATWPTEWILQSVLMAWHDYLYTGDIRSARHHYNDLKAKLLIPLEGENGLISTRTGKQNASLMQAIHYNGKELRDIVDWPHSGILGLGKSEGGETDGFVFTDYNTVVNAYYYKALTGMQEIAEALGNREDAASFAARAARVKKSFQQLLWDKKKKVFRDGTGTEHASLHANMFAMAFGLVDEKNREAVASFIRSRGMACSVYGSQFLMDAVYDGGDADYGLSLLTSQQERSWYNMIRAGSTIAMEAWDNKYKPNQDWNHAWGAVPANVIPRKLMGVEPLSPGWSTFRIKPQPGNLPWASLQLPTIKGTIHMAFRQSAGEFLLNVSVPANTTAQVELPLKKGAVIRVNGNVVKQLTTLGSGEHEISVIY